MSEPVLVSIEMRFVTTDEPNALGERIRESASMIVGREALEEFRVRSLPLVAKKRPRPVDEV